MPKNAVDKRIDMRDGAFGEEKGGSVRIIIEKNCFLLKVNGNKILPCGNNFLETQIKEDFYDTYPKGNELAVRSKISGAALYREV